jgi:heme exporter protein CcmD
MIATYASYVWACYGLTAAILVLNVWLARRSRVQAEQRTLRRLQMGESSESVSTQSGGSNAI